MKIQVVKFGAVAALLLVTRVGLCQGTFLNLSFEAAAVAQDHVPGVVSAADAFPGWTVFLGTIQQSQVAFNDLTLGATSVSLFGRGRSIEGGYSAFLQGGVTEPNATLMQVGLIPANSLSIRFRAQSGAGGFGVILGSQSLPFHPLAVGPNYTVYGADVSVFAGQVTELRFSAFRSLLGPNNWTVDSIVFSPEPIPEPGAIGLFLMATLMAAFRRSKSWV